jgi:MoxR-like ATPase
MRIRANIPVILLGETGIGKTALVRLLTNIMGIYFESKDIHSGIT